MLSSSRDSGELIKARDEVRALIGPIGAGVSDLGLLRVLRHVGDPGVAADAILMLPRPVWLQRIIGDPPSQVPDTA